MSMVLNPYAVAPPVQYTYYRLTVNAWGGGANCALREVKFGAHPTSSMTSNTAPSPFVASASTGGADAWSAFDGTNTGVDFGATGSGKWVQIYLGTTPTTITSVTITPVVTGGYFNPVDFVVSGSNDGSTFSTIYSASGVTTGWIDNTERTFTF